MKWIPIKTEDDIPKEGGYYFTRIGELKDKTCWTRSYIIQRWKEGLRNIEWLDESINQDVSDIRVGNNQNPSQLKEATNDPFSEIF